VRLEWVDTHTEAERERQRERQRERRTREHARLECVKKKKVRDNKKER